MAEANLFVLNDLQAPDPAQLKRIVEEVGVNALTPSEYELYRSWRLETMDFWEDPSDHYANLVHALKDKEEHWLKELAVDLVNKVSHDELTRREWVAMTEEAIKYLGVTPDVEPSAEVDGASDAIHPIFAEACVQFQSRAMRVLWPAGGPVKATPLGEITREKFEQARRVEQHMNYHLTEVLPHARKQQAKLLFKLPIQGSVFTKPYYDHINRVVDRSIVPPEFFVVPYKAENLENAPRYTEKARLPHNDLMKKMRSGEFIKLDLVRPTEENSDKTEAHAQVEEAQKMAEGREENQHYDEDDRHTLYYTVTDLDVPGFEDRDDDGSTGVSLPYLVITDRDSINVLSITRMWREGDELKKRLVEYHHYEFVPGLGFYGYGFYHLIGGLIRGATGSLRALLDAAGFANFKGGFKNSDVKFKSDGKKIGHGVYADVEWPGEGPLRDQFVLMNYGEPSAILYKLLQDMVDWAHRLMGITDAAVGEGSSTVPVGTQLSRVEQASMVTTEIHRAIHTVQAQEFKRIAELMWLWGEDEYAYDVPGAHRLIKRSDFDPNVVRIGLVSDPEFSSNAQRYFIAEASLQMADRNPTIYNQEALHRRAQLALNVQDVEDLIPIREEMVQRMSPVEENAAVMIGIPVKAYMEQDHQSHIVLHQQLQGTLGKQQGDISSALEAHIREHLAMAYMVQMQQETGVPLQMPEDLVLQRGEFVPMDQALENQIAARAARAAQQMAAQQQQQPDPEMLKIERDAAREDEKAQRDNARRDAMAEASIQRANLQAQEKAAINAQATAGEEARKDATAESEIQRKNVESIEGQILKRQEAREQPPGLPGA